jgi:hypothetical protein
LIRRLSPDVFKEITVALRFLPYQFVSKGETLEVTGSLPNRGDLANVSIRILASQSVVIESNGQVGPNSPTGEITAKNLNLTGKSEYTVSVPANKIAGTWTPGMTVACVAELRDSSGKVIGSDSTIRSIDGGKNPNDLFAHFAQSDVTLDMADFR